MESSDENLLMSDHQLTSPPSGMDAKYLQQMGVALQQWICKKTTTSEKSHICSLKQALISHCKKRNKLKNIPEADDTLNSSLIDDNFTLEYLEKVKGAFMAVTSSKTCVHAEVASNFALDKVDLIGQQLKDFIHFDDLEKFDMNVNCKTKQSSATTSDEEKEILINEFESRVCIKQSDNDSVLKLKKESSEDCVAMQCVQFVNKPQLLKEEGDDCLFLLASVENNLDINENATKGPPNQTITTRDEIPQPEKFYTRQDISGNITAVDVDLERLRKSESSQTPVEMRDLIDRCITSFIELKINGFSLKQVMLSKVLSHGHATSKTYKFKLADGTSVTSQTKSKLERHPQGGPSFILSIHSVYRDGDLQGLPQSLRSILFGPVVMEATSSRETVTTTTTTSIATTSSFSSSHFLTSDYHSNQKMNIGDFASDPALYPNRQMSSCNRLDIAKGVHAYVGTDQNIENAGGVVSPPPHLDGHLVHSVGSRTSQASLNKLLTSASNNLYKSETHTSVFSNSVLTHEGSKDGAMTESGLSNPATYPGPPCIDLLRLEKSFSPNDVNFAATSSISGTSVFVNGINTMRKEAAVTTSTCKVLPNNSGNALVDGNNDIGEASTSLSNQVCSPPLTGSPMHSNSLPSRPRSASTNATPSSGNPLKRSASAASQDGGIGELSVKHKPSQNRQVKSTEKSKGAISRNKILSKLLHSKSTEESLVSTALGGIGQSNTLKSLLTNGSSSKYNESLMKCSNSSPSSLLPNHAASPMFEQAETKSNVVQSSCNYQINSNSVSMSAPSDKLPLTNGPVSVGQNKLTSGSHQKYYSVSTSVSAEELQELNEIFDDFSDVFNNVQSTTGNNSVRPSPQNTNTLSHLPVKQENFLGNMSASLQNGLHLPMKPRDSTLGPPTNQLCSPNIVTSPLQNSLNPPALSTPQTLPLPVQAVPTNNAPYNSLVPTGLEMCPNRVVSSAVVPTPRIQHTPPTAIAHQYQNFGAPDICAGDEPLVDLGTFPPPAGINPRSAIPIPPNLNSPMNNGNAMKFREGNMMQPTMQNVPRLGFSNALPNSRMPSHMQMDIHNSQQSPNGLMNGNIPNGNYSCNFSGTVSPKGYSPVSSNLRPKFDNAVQHPNKSILYHQQQQGAVMNDMRSSMLQQVRHDQPIFNGDASMNSGISPYQYNPPQQEIPRFANQRRNGPIMRKVAPNLQRTISSPSGQNIYGSVNPTRFMTGPQSVQQFSPIKSTPHSLNSPMLVEEFRPSLPYNQPLAGNAMMSPPNTNQFNGSISGTYNIMTSATGPNLHFGANTGVNVSITSPISKPPPIKRQRRRSVKKSKSKPPEDTSWQEMTSNVLKQRPPMTINNVHQRPQPGFKPSLDGVLSGNSVSHVIAPQNNPMVEHPSSNLNALVNDFQNKADPSNKMNFETPSNVTSSDFSSTSSNNLNWSDMTPTLTSPSFSSDFLPDLMDTSLSSKPASLPLPSGMSLNTNLSENNSFLPAIQAEVDSTMNANLNNNNPSDFITNCNFSDTITSPILSPDSTIPTKKTAPRRTAILESLLLKKD